MGDARIIDFNAALELRRREEASLASHFVNYHVHSEGSFLDGYSPVTSIAKRARELGQAAIGLSDHGECNQHYAFQKACIAEGVHPIFGMEGYYVDDIAQKKEVPNSHITLIAASQQGLANLWALSSVAYQRKYFHKKPLADLELLRHYRDGLWASDGCLLTELARAILVRGDEEEARQIYGRLLAVFGDRFFSELHTWQFMNPRTDDEIKFLDTKMCTAQANALASEFNRAKLRLATELGIPQVVVNDAHHTRPEEWELKDMVWRINTGNKGDQLPEGQKADHLMGDQELYYWMGRHGIDAPHVERAIDMSWQIAQTCVAEIRPTLGMPSFTGNDHDDIEKFLDLVTEGFKRKVIDGGLDQERYLQRAESECQLIIDKGFCFPPGTQVSTAQGLRAIGTIRPGDYVETRAGQQRVARVSSRPVEEQLAEIAVAGSYRKLSGTKEHPVLTPSGWQELGRFRRGDEVAVDAPEGVDSPFDLLGLALDRGWWVSPSGEGFTKVVLGRWKSARRSKGWAPDKLMPSPALMYVVGLWVAEGHLYDPDSSTCPGQVGWTLHRDEMAIRDRLASCLRELGMGELRTYAKTWAGAPNHKGLLHIVTNHPLALFLSEVVGTGVYEKRLSPWLMSLSSESLRAFVDGWFDGDGTTKANGRKIVDTCNPVLAFQLRQILLRTGIWATEISYRWLDRQKYRVCWQEERKKAPYGARRDGDRWWVRVKGVTSRHYSGLVYNLSVDGDPTYVAEGIRVHNCGYFCVDEDMVRAAKTGSWAQYVKGPHKEPIGVGPGRGSAGGSLVTWLLGITAIDPIRYGLLFERFLTPARKSPPDIDIDFPQSRLGDMVKYLGARWGHDHVCTIGTITRNAPKAMLRDLARAMGRQKVPQADVEAMSKIIDKATKLAASAMEARGEHAGDKGDEVRWDEILQEKGGDLAPWAHKHAELFRLLGLLVGIARQSGKHPSGVLMNKDPLLGRIPMRTRHHGTAKEVVTTQFDMLEVEELGGVKFDLLGLRNLDTLEVTKRLIRERHGVDIDWEALPEHDPAVWPQIHRGRTTGIFQLTAGTTRTAIELKPTSIEDLALLISIIRPGVKDAGLTERFLRRRAGVESTTYDHPLMEPITADTHGVLVYQEQMMRASRDLAGFSADEADDLRKALGKKYMDKIKAMWEEFAAGCLANTEFTALFGGPPDGGDFQRDAALKVIEKIWTSIEASGRYAFGHAHATGYAMTGYWEIWPKHHYAAEFVMGLLVSDPANTPEYIREARRMGLAVLPPDVNLSGQKFTITDDSIRYGLDALRGIAAASARDIVAGRPYRSLQDYLATAGKGANKTVIVNLIKVGALDSLGDRAELLRQYEYHMVTRDLAESTRTNPEKLAAIVERRLAMPGSHIEIPDFTDPAVIYGIEQELCGRHITVDPLESYLSLLEGEVIYDPADIDDADTGARLTIAGQVTKVTRHAIKSGFQAGQEMAFVTVRFAESDFEFTAFPREWTQVKGMISLGAPVACECRKDGRGARLVELVRLDNLASKRKV